MKSSFLALGISFLFLTLNQNTDSEQAFLQNFEPFCGYAYAGKTTYFDLGAEELKDPELLMLLEKCKEDEVRIPFWVDDDRSRTWILDIRDEGLRLSHDHRYEDGTEHDANMYGGFSDERGSETKHFYPADEATIEDRPAREINVWSTELDIENDSYFYRLYLDGELSYEAKFDLSEPIPFDEVY